MKTALYMLAAALSLLCLRPALAQDLRRPRNAYDTEIRSESKEPNNDPAREETRDSLKQRFGVTEGKPHHPHEKNLQEDTAHKVHNLKEFFSRGHFGGHFRYYYMSTINYQELSDYYANGVSGKLEYHSADFKGFQVGVGAIFIFNVGSSDFTKTDPMTDRRSRYEPQLFDLEHPDNRHELDRVEELFARYNFGSSSFAQYGRLTMYSPLVNLQDTRMKPYAMQGFWSEIREIKNWRFNFGWFDRASPRSTVEWVPLGESIGIYSQGFDENGAPMDYREAVETAGLAIAGATWTGVPHLKAQFWNYLIENVSNSVFAQADYLLPLAENRRDLIFGAQILQQNTVGEGGSAHPEHRYMPKGQSNRVYSARLGYQNQRWRFTASWLYADKNGRFTFPREWGREQFYATVSRGRMEGLGNTHVLMTNTRVKPFKDLSLAVDFGRVWAPEPDEYQFNKYRNLSYYQFNFDAKYHFHKLLEGLEVRFLYVYKHAGRPGAYREDISPLFYAANFHHFNLITNINF